MRCWLLVPVMLVVTYVPWPGLVFLLADSGLYQGVVDEGCEVEYGGKRADKGEGQRADGGDAGSVGQRRGGGVQSLFTSDRLWRIFYNFISVLYGLSYNFSTVSHGFSKILYLFFTGFLGFSGFHNPCFTAPMNGGFNPLLLYVLIFNP
jgi:hypothetical protein